MLVYDMQDPDAVLREVDWGLLAFFSSLFIVVKGFEQTEIPRIVWDSIFPHIDLNSISGLAIFSGIVLVCS